MSNEWYRKSLSDIRDKFGVSPEQGLSQQEAEQRLDKYGPNKIKTKKTPSWLAFFWDHLREFVSILLVIVGLIALLSYFLLEPAIERLAEALIVFAIVVINATVGAQQESKSEQTAQRIKEMMKTQTLVLRGGEKQQLDSEKLVPGDIVILEQGDKVPADMRLIEAKQLKAQESVLTGESTAVNKGNRLVLPIPTASSGVLRSHTKTGDFQKTPWSWATCERWWKPIRFIPTTSCGVFSVVLIKKQNK